jgi:pyruvate dehydrogenase E1 component alpha subunit
MVSADRRASTAEVSPISFLEMYRRMLLIRYFEERAIQLHAQNEIVGPLHTSVGQEAAIVGACMAVRNDDYMTGTHRSHGHPLGKGAAPGPLMAELMGRRDGVCRGKGGSMHLADFAVGSLGESGIVGSALPVAVGAGLSAAMRGTDQVCLAFFGDGAANVGAFHEALNLASVWRLPVVFFCENNQYAYTTATADTSAVAAVADRAAAYAMAGETVDGQDCIVVFEAVSAAVERARSGAGPSLVEAKTYRYNEHAQLGTPARAMGGYRSASEIDAWRARDPIELFRIRMLDGSMATAEELERIESAVRDVIDEAVTFALASPAPDPEEAFEGLYVSPFPIMRGY